MKNQLHWAADIGPLNNNLTPYANINPKYDGQSARNPSPIIMK